MSEALVFVPGIMGTRLRLPDGEEVWPPRPSETIFGYNRIDKLQSDKLIVGDIIDDVSCVKFYSPIQKDFDRLGFAPGGAQNLVEFPYDWRLDLFDLAGQLADRLDQVDADSLSIVAHSMGGLICRIMLESGLYSGRAWFPKVKLFTTLATPHNGAPLALGRILGLDSTLGISAEDFATLAKNTKYPSGYQLLPAPGEDACWNQDDDFLGALDIYDRATGDALGLVPELVDRARAVHDAFANGAPPPHVRYFFFAGSGYETVTRVNVAENGDGGFDRDDMSMTHTRDAGDGTVPMWSALPRREQKQVIINNHVGVFRGNAFKRVFYRLFGVNIGPALEADRSVNMVQVSTAKHVYAKTESIDVTIAGESALAGLSGTFRLVEIDETGREIGPARDMAEITYKGAAAPYLTLQVGSADKEGHYRLDFDGNLEAEEAPVFSVAQ